MQIYLKEKIGKAELFSGRYKELKSLLNWVELAKNELARSEAMLSRRKTGKTAIMHRLYNILFHQNDGKMLGSMFCLFIQSKVLQKTR
ncbi:MAG: hypothetical protein OMM_10500 [Candidatus Magnetoglobus multicellularis str. Araruama]|uniref:Uncharacterized protein n=1 Tax=Candidatus Magnetoglobus multicellularis str. Araruama TaxID=890399 RepID=A0A1V1P0S8_9BACT|nr:MAG: hypothetical protein OMM_10500 [Candidatus Magnetoglobus multicellularis str. Araruama]